jgi:hypothetical protein
MKFRKVIPTKNRHELDEPFNREAGNNWLDSDESEAVTTHEPGFSPGRLHAWKKRCGKTTIYASSAIFYKTMRILSEPVRSVSRLLRHFGTIGRHAVE